LRQSDRRAARSATDADSLRVTDLVYAAAREPVNFHLARGEIVGVAGLVGAGRTELARAMFGIDPTRGGSIEVAGRPLRRGNPRWAIRAGLCLVPEDRKAQGLVLQMSLAENISLSVLPALGRWGLLNRRAERALTQRQVRELSIRAARQTQTVLQLSGGNQQKVVLAKWLAMNPAVLLLDEPTRGVDVGAKSEIYALISQLAGRGVGILLISSDLEEIIALSDRVLVMHQGRIRGELSGARIDEESIMRLAIGNDP
jgi:ABC-type sugar transport system ATPase subunit